MVRNLTTICLLLLVAGLSLAAEFYQFPQVPDLQDQDIYLLRRPSAGSRNITGQGLTAAMKNRTTAWGFVTGKPPVFPPTVHGSSHQTTGNDPLTLATGQITGLDNALAGKSDTGHLHSGAYEPANSNIQTHIGSTDNPHATTAAQVGAAESGHLHTGTYEPASANIQTHVGTTSGNPHGTDATMVAYNSSTVGAVLDLLAPAPPANLSTRTLSIASTYTARESSTGTVRSGVINTTTPTITVSGAFGDGNAGTLTALIDSSASGSRVLSTASDVGTYTSLQILTDVDPYAGVFGQQGFYKQLTARVIPSPGVTVKVVHTAQLSHSTTGSTPALTWYSDDAVTPSASTPSVSGVTHTSGKHVSGVECLTTGDTIQTSSTATNSVHSFYNNSQILRFSGSQVTTLNYLPGTPPADNASVASGTQNVVVASGYSAAAQITATAYNSTGGTGAATLTSNVRIDSVSSEAARKLSGSGDWPLTGYGGAYDSTQLLTAGVYLNELQMINGIYQYPPATNYTGNLPAGPNYSTGLGTADRWVTFAISGSFSGTGQTITINGATNFGGSAVISGLKMYARVDGASPTAGWVDLNAAYPGVGNPTNNGDAALAPGSTATSRILTFGSVVRTGTLYLRIGLPSGSTKSFTGAS